MNSKNAKSHSSTASRTFETIQDIYEFEDQLFEASLTPEDRKVLEELLENEHPQFATDEERDEHLRRAPDFQFRSQYVEKETGDLIHSNDPALPKLIESGEAILGAEYLDQKVVEPFRTGKTQEASLSLEPIIFKTKGKTPPSVPYLKVSVTTAMAENSEANHLLHTRTREQSL